MLNLEVLYFTIIKQSFASTKKKIEFGLSSNRLIYFLLLFVLNRKTCLVANFIQVWDQILRSMSRTTQNYPLSYLKDLVTYPIRRFLLPYLQGFRVRLPSDDCVLALQFYENLTNTDYSCLVSNRACFGHSSIPINSLDKKACSLIEKLVLFKERQL